MYTHITEEQLNAACKLAAESLNVDVAVFKRAVFDDMQKQYDREDIETWLNEQGYAYNNDDVEQLLSTVREDWDADRGTWSNIESAYYNNDMHLPYADDEDDVNVDDESEDDEYSCQIAFPQCQKCQHANECEAYQHALEAQTEAAQMGIADFFKHDTDNCDAFEPANTDDECNCEHCSAHCAGHADCPTAMKRVEQLEHTINKESHDECPLGGDISNDCADCCYAGDYHYVDGKCVLRNNT